MTAKDRSPRRQRSAAKSPTATAIEALEAAAAALGPMAKLSPIVPDSWTPMQLVTLRGNNRPCVNEIHRAAEARTRCQIAINELRRTSARRRGSKSPAESPASESGIAREA